MPKSSTGNEGWAKMRKRLGKEVAFPMIYHKDLSEKQKEILRLILEEFMPQRKIAQRLKISRQAVEKTVHTLREKGYIKRYYQRGVKGGVGVGQSTLYKGRPVKSGKIEPSFPVEKVFRGHNFQFDVGILRSSVFYESTRLRCNTLIKGLETVKLYKHKICIFSNQSFFGESGSVCSMDATQAFLVLVQNLEFALKVDLLKDRKQNMRMVRGHIAEVGSEVASFYKKERKKLRVRGKDGVVWCLTDASKGLLELETVHPEDHVSDMDDTLTPFLNDLKDLARSGKLPLISELLQVQGVQVALGLKSAKDLNRITQFLVSKFGDERP